MAYNLFSQKPPVETPKLTKPIQAYDPTKSVEQNMAGQGQPSAQNVMAAYQTPQAQQTLVSRPQQTRTMPAINPNSDTSGMDALSTMYTSPQDEERMRKASVANQRIMAVADALRHIGNIYNTVNYAPAQKFNSPVLEEQQRYEKGKALRDKANLTYLNYQQAKAAQDAKQRRWEAEQKAKADQWNATFRYNAARDAANLAEKQRQYDTTFGLNKEKQKATEERWKRQDAETRRHHGVTEANTRAALAETRRHHGVVESNGGAGGKVERRDTRRGYLTKRGATAGEIKATYHQMYEWGKQHKDPKTGKPYIDEAALKGQMTYGSYSWGGTSISQDLKERAVNKMLMEHDDAAVRMHSKYGWEWHEQTPNDKSNGGSGGGAPASEWDQYAEDSEDENWDKYLDN